MHWSKKRRRVPPRCHTDWRDSAAFPTARRWRRRWLEKVAHSQWLLLLSVASNAASLWNIKATRPCLVLMLLLIPYPFIRDPSCSDTIICLVDGGCSEVIRYNEPQTWTPSSSMNRIIQSEQHGQKMKIARAFARGRWLWLLNLANWQIFWFGLGLGGWSSPRACDERPDVRRLWHGPVLRPNFCPIIAGNCDDVVEVASGGPRARAPGCRNCVILRSGRFHQWTTRVGETANEWVKEDGSQ